MILNVDLQDDETEIDNYVWSELKLAGKAEINEPL